MEIEKLVSIVESILFVASDAISLKDLFKIFSEDDAEISAKDIRTALDRLRERYKASDSGLSLVETEDRYQIIAKTDNNPYVEKITIKKKKKTLTQASLEVISIIAYKQPITRIEIDEIRGVKSDAVVGNLLELGLIEEKGRLDRIGRPILYGTTDSFLREFGIDRIKNLPQVEAMERKDE